MLRLLALVFLLTVIPMGAAADITGLWYARASCRASVLNLLPDTTFRLLFYERNQTGGKDLEMVVGSYAHRDNHILLVPDAPTKFLRWSQLEFGLLAVPSGLFVSSSYLPDQTVLRSAYENSQLAFFNRKVDCAHPVRSTLPEFFD